MTLKKNNLQILQKFFLFSYGWFRGFKNHCNFHNIEEAASVDEQDAKKTHQWQKTLTEEEEGYILYQIFNFNETSFHIKCMPSRTYILQAEKHASGFKGVKK